MGSTKSPFRCVPGTKRSGYKNHLNQSIAEVKKSGGTTPLPHMSSRQEGKWTTLAYAINTTEISHASNMKGTTCISRDAILQVYKPGNYYTTPTNTEDS